MRSFKLRQVAFQFHRYVGLSVGLILVIVGLTGSLLVFEHEMDQRIIQYRFGQVIPQEQRLPLSKIAEIVTTAYRDRPEFKLAQFDIPPNTETYKLRLRNSKNEDLEVFVNPYTGKILGDRSREGAFFSRVVELHYTLFAKEVGRVVVGIVAFLLCLLSVTGLLLWPGWRKLVTGFRIKWDAHPKRLNFDLHKVAGITSVMFLLMIAVSGFCWNFYEYAEPAIYALTLTPKPPELKSTVLAGNPRLSIDEIAQQADAALPGAITTFISIPTKPDGVFYFYKKQPQDAQNYANVVQLDQYSGRVLRVVNSQTATLGDRILNAFVPMHYGTFWGLPSRILYVFVGLAPLLLSITGFVMWRYRKKHNEVMER
ncbi:PepSY-associated TM helix domain-containing protein [Leptothermofonsia sp. ETS-13]|uniref:PepSY-associated TM helix domain-containing protein n=1 Tax=Leptothermofonsia sp. ETS-13 TaxID=3035696 RepID=UPI003BA019A3